MGLDEQALPRECQVPPDAFGLERLAAHAAFMGEFGRWREA